MRIKALTWVPAVLIMIIIYTFSAKPAVTSDKGSMFIARKILGVFEEISDTEYETDIEYRKLGIIDHYVRKAAHFTEYAVLAAAIAFPLWVRKLKGFRLFVITVLFTALYAASDEIHQWFVPGRSCRFTDVLIDTSGAVIGTIIFIFIAKKVSGRRKKDNPVRQTD